MRKIPSPNRSVMLLLAGVSLLFLMVQAYRSSVRSLRLSRAELGLSHVYEALDRYEARNGVLPVLAFYPEDVFGGADSIRELMSRYLIDGNDLVSPGAHPILRRTGLTYVWNTAFNGKSIPREGDAQWLLIDIQALEPLAPRAHQKGYLCLFSDGTIRLLDSGPSAFPPTSGSVY